MALFGQPQRHMAEAAADIQYAQRPWRQRLAQVSLEHGEADSALGATVDFFGKTGGQLVEVAVVRRAHTANLRSLSASLASRAWSMSMPNSLHSRVRYMRMSATS